MADRYWVGGTATWDATAGTKWATTSGGAGGAAVPTSADNVFFDAASGAVTITLSGTRPCANFDTTGFTGAFSGTATPILQVSGNFTLGAGMTWNSSMATVQILAASNITTNGVAIRAFTIGSAGGTCTLQDALNCSSSNLGISGTLNGILDTNGFSVTCGAVVSNSAGARTLTLGASTITCIAATLAIDFQNTGSFTFSGASSTWLFTSTGTITTNMGGFTYGSITVSAGASASQSVAFGTMTCNVLTLNAPRSLSVGGTITATSWVFSGFSTSVPCLIISNTPGTQRTISVASGAVTFPPGAIRDILGTGGATFAANDNYDIGNNSGITFAAPGGGAAGLLSHPGFSGGMAA